MENSIHYILEKIQLRSYNQKFNILQATSGTTNQTRKKYRELIEKVRMITNCYKNSDIVNYVQAHLDFILSNCRHNFLKSRNIFDQESYSLTILPKELRKSYLYALIVQKIGRIKMCIEIFTL